jgi:hypothetical protein
VADSLYYVTLPLELAYRLKHQLEDRYVEVENTPTASPPYSHAREKEEANIERLLDEIDTLIQDLDARITEGEAPKLADPPPWEKS